MFSYPRDIYRDCADLKPLSKSPPFPLGTFKPLSVKLGPASRGVVCV